MDLIQSSHLPDFPIVIATPVAWGEMDSYGHVNNIVFFRHFENARIAFLDHIEFREPARNNDIGPILASTQCRFRRPLTYPDTVHVGARVLTLESDRFELEFRTVSVNLGGIVAQGSGVIVAYDYTLARKALIPERVRQQIEALGRVPPSPDAPG